jgi:hypothetical protein
VSTVQVPQEVLDAVAEAETDEPAAETTPEAPATAEVAEPATETPSEVPTAAQDEEEVSLEAILEDLKRREGRAE